MRTPPLDSPQKALSEGAVRLPFPSFFSGNESLHTTGGFASLPGGYCQHCVPTALTNALLTLHNQNNIPKLEGKTAEELFLEIARLGMRRFLYWNFQIFGYGGGVPFFLLGIYARMVFSQYHIADYKPVFVPFSGPEGLRRALRRGSLCLLQVYFHKTYGTHLMTAYGAEMYMETTGRQRLFFKVADGWSRHIRYLDPAERNWMGYLEIRKIKGAK